MENEERELMDFTQVFYDIIADGEGDDWIHENGKWTKPKQYEETEFIKLTVELKEVIKQLCFIVGKSDKFDSESQGKAIVLMDGIVRNGYYDDTERKMLNKLRKVFLDELQDVYKK